MISWERGKNFSQTKYVLKELNTFIPHVRSNFHASIPRNILECFNVDLNQKLVCLLHITGEDFDSVRIKNLSKEGNSFVFSLKSEKEIQNLEVKVLDIKNEKSVLYRDKGILNFVPRQTSLTPIYVFSHKDKYIIGGHYKKEIAIPRNLKFDDDFLAAIGLYLAEGGKTAATFTNSWPKIINSFLKFAEGNFNFNRKTIKATIYCNPSLRNKQKQLELFWKKETGIQNLSKTLHLGKNSRSPQGTLELYFCSTVLKEILLSFLKNKIFYDNINFISGYFSGDASPILQTMYNITHQITFDKKYFGLYSDVLKTFFKGHNPRLIIKNKFVLYADWNLNRQLLLKDIYQLNPINRLKFAKRFLELPKTKKTIKKDKELKKYKKEMYPKMLNELITHYKTLANLNLFDKNKIKVLIDEYNIS